MEEKGYLPDSCKKTALNIGLAGISMAKLPSTYVLLIGFVITGGGACSYSPLGQTSLLLEFLWHCHPFFPSRFGTGLSTKLTTNAFILEAE